MNSSWTILKELDPSLHFDLRYATTHNFLGRVVYPAAICVARTPVAHAIAAAQARLRREGFGLKIFDAYRPLAVQRIMWEVMPDDRYIANPAHGSRHNRGAAVDLTLVTPDGREVTMPSEFDHFGPEAHRDHVSPLAGADENRARLERAMVDAGFIPFATEWWHFDHRDWAQFPVEDIPLTHWE